MGSGSFASAGTRARANAARRSRGWMPSTRTRCVLHPHDLNVGPYWLLATAVMPGCWLWAAGGFTAYLA